MTLDNEQKVSFLPFHAINEFMTDEYRFEVIRIIMEQYSSLTGERRSKLDHMTKKYIKIPGFRNSDKAPTSLRIRPLAEQFLKHPDLVAGLIGAWAELQKDLSHRIYELLSSRNWDLLPFDTDRSKLPGFITAWPHNESFDSIYQEYQVQQTGSQNSFNDVALMTVWLSGRLPYSLDEESSLRKDNDLPTTTN